MQGRRTFAGLPITPRRLELARLYAVLLLALAVFHGVVDAITFTVTNTGDRGAGSLRQAITDANSSPALDIIEFDIPGPGPHTIQPRSPLPIITDPVVIDGYTQPGASRNTNPLGSNAVLQIELDGSNLPEASFGTNGLTITAGFTTVSGLVINRFPGEAGIVLRSKGNNRLDGNYIGTDVTGTTDLGDDDVGCDDFAHCP